MCCINKLPNKSCNCHQTSSVNTLLNHNIPQCARGTFCNTIYVLTREWAFLHLLTLRKLPSSAVCSCQFPHCPFMLQIPDPAKATEYKKGYVMRKCCVNPDGRHSEYRGFFFPFFTPIASCAAIVSSFHALPMSSAKVTYSWLFRPNLYPGCLPLRLPPRLPALLFSAIVLAHALAFSFCSQLFSF